jgi:putative zinc finger/helix-turn-helix YgiT family protein
MTECTACGAPVQVAQTDYPFEESGLRNVVLRNVGVARCEECGNEDVLIPHLDELMRVLALAVISQPYPLRGEDVRFLRKYVHMTQVQLAELLDVDKTTLSKWETNDDKPGRQSDRLIRAVVLALGEGLKQTMEKVVRGFAGIEDSALRPTMMMDPASMEYQYA